MVLLRQQNKGNKYFFLVAATKNFAAATKRLVDRTKYFVVVTFFFAIPMLTNDFVGITKPFIPCIKLDAAQFSTHGKKWF